MFDRLFLALKTIYDQRYTLLVAALIQARKNAQLTQAQVAEKLHKPQSYIAKIEGYERKLDVLEFTQLCAALNIQAHILIQLLQQTTTQ